MSHDGIRLADNKRYLQTKDGQPFFWLADTWWYGLSDRLPSPEPFEQLVETRAAQGFTVIQLVVGVPPEIPLTDDAARSGGELPWTNAGQPNPAYFEAIEPKIQTIVDHGLVPCLVGGWGPQISAVGAAAMKAFWQEMITRFGKYPVVWCLSGEVDLISSPVEIATDNKIASLARKILKQTANPLFRLLTNRRRTVQLQQWQAVAEMIKKVDTHHHLLTVHPHTQQTARQLFSQAAWLDINTIQSGHALDRAAYLVEMPLQHSLHTVFINMEPWYEGILGNFGPSEQRYAFWMSILAGAKGYSYGADGLWNMRQPDESFLTHWGHQSWQEAIALPGAQQIAAAKQWLQQFHWWTLQANLICMNPYWSKTTLGYPLCAETDDGTIICYFPHHQKQQSYEWLLIGDWEGEWFDAATLQSMQSISLSSQRTLTSPQHQDSVLIMRKESPS